MKKFKYLFLIFICFFFISCSDDVDTTKKVTPMFEGLEIVDDTKKLKGKMAYVPEITVEDVKLDYYALPNEILEVAIHIYNPNEFEIMSFTINDNKYQSYEFVDGSNSELIIVEIEAPSNGGKYSYTIDAIKYIDGTTIKDVDMSSGDKTIDFGITYDSAPSVSLIDEDISYNSYIADFVVYDDNNIINSLIGIRAYLFDANDNILQYVKLKDGTVSFTNLKYGTTYQYQIIAVYNLLDGKGSKTVKLYEASFTTKSIVDIKLENIDYTSINYNITTIYSNAQLNKIELIKDNVATEITNDSYIDKLYSNCNYSMRITYTYNNEQYEFVKEFKTKEYSNPSVDFFDYKDDGTFVSFDYKYNNLEKIDTSLYVNVYLKDSLVSKLDIKDTFKYLNDKNYIFEFVCEYDKKDGNDKEKIIITKEFTSKKLQSPTIGINYSIEGDTLSGEVSIVDYDNTYISHSLYLCDNQANILKPIYDLSNLNELNRNTDYVIKCDYLYNLNDGEGNIRNTYIIEFSTSKIIPTIELKAYYVLQDKIGIDIYENDPNVVGEIKFIRLYDENNYFLSETTVSNSFEFSNLSSNTKYVAKVIYYYDLNDGNGSQDVEYDLKFKTAKIEPTVVIDSTTGDETINVIDYITDLESAIISYNIELYNSFNQLVYNGTNKTISNLLSNHEYTIKYTIIYDLNDMTNVKSYTCEHKAKTKEKLTPSVELVVKSIDYTTIELGYILNDINDIFVFNKIEVIYNDNVISEINDIEYIFIDKLYTNNSYKFKLYYSYDLNDGYGIINETYELDVKTLQRENVILEYDNLSATSNSIIFDYKFKDSTNTLVIENIALYSLDNSLLQMAISTDVREFNDLEEGTIYKLVTTYSYDLGDGMGKIIDKVIQNYATVGDKLLINGLEIINSNSPKVGEEIHIKVLFENPNQINLAAIYINDERYSVIQQDIIDGFVVVQYTPDVTEACYFDIILTGYSYYKLHNGDNLEIIENLFQNYKHNILIMDDINITYFGYTNRLKYAAVGKETSLTLIYDSVIPYEIEEICFYTTDYEIIITKNKINVINDSEVEFKYTFSTLVKYFDNTYVKYVKYSLDEDVATSYPIYSTPLGLAYSDEVKQIDEASDFLELSDYYVYELVCDIDFSTMANYKGVDFIGIILGNGHKIKNFSMIEKNCSGNYGLFGDFKGYAENIVFENPYVNIEVYGQTYFGLFNAQGYNVLDKIIVNNAYIEINIANVLHFSDFAGISGWTKCIMNSSMSGNIVVVCDEVFENSNFAIIGIVVTGNAINCINYANIVGVRDAAGITNCGAVDGCINYGNISSRVYAAGIAITGNGEEIKNSINYGSITSFNSVGIVLTTASITNCINYGNIYGQHAAGISANPNIIRNVINYGAIYTGGYGSGIVESYCNAYNVINIGNIYMDEDSTNYPYVAGIFSSTAAEAFLIGAVSIGDIYIPSANLWNANYLAYISSGQGYLDAKDNTVYQAYDFVVHDKEKQIYDSITPIATLDMLNSKSFWLSLGFEESNFNFDNLDYQNGMYPILRFEKELLEKVSKIFETNLNS